MSGVTSGAPGPAAVTCPYCLGEVAFDEERLYTRNSRAEYIRLDLSQERGHPGRRYDVLRNAFQECPNTPGVAPHHLPVPFLIHGRPLTVAMVGSSFAGKTHLLAAMLGELEQGGLDGYGLACQSLNPDWHREFLQQKVQRLYEGKVLAPTTESRFAVFANGLLVSRRGSTRPVMFFDLAGEDLVAHGEVTRFLTKVDAFIFVIDPLRALRLASLDRVRAGTGIPASGLGDAAFSALLGRIAPRADGYLDARAAVVVNKSDLVRFEPPVGDWLGRSSGVGVTDRELRAESRDVYAFVRQHGSRAWLRPFAECERCTLHFVSATGGRERNGEFPNGVVPRRVLTPLISIFAMCGLLPAAELRGTGL